MNKTSGLLFILFFAFSCKSDDNKIIDVSNIVVTTEIDRFDKKFYNPKTYNLAELKNEYPYLFPAQNPDSIWIQKRENKDENLLFNKANAIFNNDVTLKKQFENLFQHIKYYFSNFETPKIVTLISNVDYKNNVIYADNLLLISLDMYLGKSDETYADYPAYLSNNFDEKQLIVDAANEISKRFYNPKPQRQFMNTIISEGKKMYLLDVFLPQIANSNKMGYLQNELNWVEENEAQIWKYFIDNKLLFSTDSKLNARFVNTAPFSKFYMNLDKESPGRIGVWLGWQIVSSYMKNNNVTLQQLLQMNAQEVYNKSKYKPKK